MPYVGYYINLDRSPERRTSIEAQIARLRPTARYRRFQAVDGNPDGIVSEHMNDAQLGCLLSHYMVLQLHLDGANHLHVVEDDAVMTVRTVRFIESVIASGLLDDHDLLFTSTILPGSFNAFRELRTTWRNSIKRANDGSVDDVAFSLIPYFAGMDSYLVNRRSIPMLCELVRQEVETGACRPFDVLLHERASRGELRARCLFPFITSVLPEGLISTTIPNNGKQLSYRAVELLRHSFFVDCDQQTMLDLADRDLTNSVADPQATLHSRIAGFFASDDFQTL